MSNQHNMPNKKFLLDPEKKNRKMTRNGRPIGNNPITETTEWVSLLTYPWKPDGTLHTHLDPTGT